MPAELPGKRRHGNPEQQSAFAELVPPDAMHAVALQVNCPCAFGTQGLPPQQSAAVAHVVPAERQPTPLSLGTPV